MSSNTSSGDPGENDAAILSKAVVEAWSSDADGTYSDHSDDSCTAVSLASTDMYDQEPFDTFVHKIYNLIAALFPNDIPVNVERMPGGSSHRILRGVLGCDQDFPRTVVVRIPRFSYQHHSHLNQVAVLRFLKSTTTIPVPRVYWFDNSASNIISQPFMVLEHLQGSCLDEVYQGLPVDVKKSVARSVAHLLKQFSEVTFDAIGTLLSASPDGIRFDVEHLVYIVESSQYVPPATPARARSVRDYLEERWSFFVAEEQLNNPGESFFLKMTSDFRAAMGKLPIPDTPARIVLYHTDLAPRNIFIDTESGTITGVLGWDDAESAPVEAAWQMPAWLWDDEACASNPLNWVGPDDIPCDSEAAEIREVFIDEIEDALPGFVETVRRNRLVFQILAFARLGWHTEQSIYQAGGFLAKLEVPYFFTRWKGSSST
ncbi:kinase-like domain-containing protein [Gautieria morchelliformis]|nr:kinase-like domain-containing protein [Gautieria morchelliformis]